MSSSSSYCRGAHRGAIALNNMAVTLMERNSYREAAETLKDSIWAMEHCVNSRNGEEAQSHGPGGGPSVSMGSESDFTKDMEAKLRNAMMRKLYRRNPTTRRSSQPLDIDVTSVHDGDVSIAKRAMLQDLILSHSNVIPIRIDCTDEVERDLDNDSAIILYNFGIVHSCMATGILATSKSELDSSSASRILSATAVHLFESTITILLQQYEAYDNDIFSQAFFVLLGIMATNRIRRALLFQHRHREAEAADRRLQGLERILQDIEQHSEKIQMKEQCAPAA